MSSYNTINCKFLPKNPPLKFLNLAFINNLLALSTGHVNRLKAAFAIESRNRYLTVKAGFK